MLKAFAPITLATLLIAGPAYAQPVKYIWSGFGINVPGSSKCPTYKMTINVTVAGDSVKALFEQEGRPERHFETTKDAKGMFQTTAVVGRDAAARRTASGAPAIAAIRSGKGRLGKSRS